MLNRRKIPSNPFQPLNLHSPFQRNILERSEVLGSTYYEVIYYKPSSKTPLRL